MSSMVAYLNHPMDTGYPHDGRADKDSFPHDRRADKDSYPHDRHKATPNKFLDSHPNFVKNWGGWEVFIFYFLFSR